MTIEFPLNGQLHDPYRWIVLRIKPGLPNLYWVECLTWSTRVDDATKLDRRTALQMAPMLAAWIAAGEELQVRPADDPQYLHPPYTVKTGSWDDSQLKPEFSLE